MPYVGSDGNLQRARPFGVAMLYDTFWGVITFFNLFFRSLLHLDEAGSQFGGGSQRAPRTPGRRMGGFRGGSSVPSPPMCGPGGG